METRDIGPCIAWPGYHDKKGYGRKNGVLMHRVEYCKHHGISLDAINGQVIRHKCDNPGCINPEHLEPGSIADNNHDTVGRGRQAKGEKNGSAKLTTQQVSEIRSRYVGGSRTHGAHALSREYGVCNQQISRIIRGKVWRDLTIDADSEQEKSNEAA